jgi:hypothetical protein
MDYSIIGKIQKAKEYAEQPQRVTFHNFQIEFRGDNNTYTLTLGSDGWDCTCPGFQKYGICPHIMTLEKLFAPMLDIGKMAYAQGQNVVSDVEKATKYATETDRITFHSFQASFKGDHNDYQISYNDGKWDCDNPYFRTHGVCSHTMAMERILAKMVKPVLREQSVEEEIES